MTTQASPLDSVEATKLQKFEGWSGSVIYSFPRYGYRVEFREREVGLPNFSSLSILSILIGPSGHRIEMPRDEFIAMIDDIHSELHKEET